jgi:hypothetical protein
VGIKQAFNLFLDTSHLTTIETRGKGEVVSSGLMLLEKGDFSTQKSYNLRGLEDTALFRNSMDVEDYEGKAEF